MPAPYLGAVTLPYVGGTTLDSTSTPSGDASLGVSAVSLRTARMGPEMGPEMPGGVGSVTMRPDPT